MEITITAGELLDQGLWEDACELLNINIWTISEGQMDLDYTFSLSMEQAGKLGLSLEI